ncbi:MAG: thiolase family protein [Thermoleophilia bacterium]|nr:thiolase family protein [Thermoleophilia bacterium]
MYEAYIIDAVRSPVGKRNGSLSTTHAVDLAAHALRAVVQRSGVGAEHVEDVLMGCVTQVGEQGWNVGRMAVLAAGFPVEVGGVTVNRMCGSSLQTTNSAAHAIMSGQADLVIAAGVESMSRAPMMSDGGQVPDSITGPYDIVMQGLSAELIAQEWGITREQQDTFALQSQERAIAAREAGHFDAEIAPIDVTDPDGNTSSFAADETPRASTADKLASLKPAFLPEEQGTVTAGNASQICDGSAAVLLASAEAVERHGLTPRAKVVSTAIAGVDPTKMLHGNPEAVRLALARASLSLDDMGLIEINEAFASVVLQAMHDLELGGRTADVNPNGGGISLGHPLGASGARILATMLSELDRRDARHGVATMCIGFGQAIATVVERV